MLYIILLKVVKIIVIDFGGVNVMWLKSIY